MHFFKTTCLVNDLKKAGLYYLKFTTITTTLTGDNVEKNFKNRH